MSVCHRVFDFCVNLGTVFLCRMDIHVRRIARKYCWSDCYCTSKSFVHGTLSGEDSDMNVQATEIARIG